MCQESSTFLEYVSQISIIVASLTAIYGVSTWRREYRGKKDADLAEETLTLFYKAKDAISAIRNPFGSSNEGTSRKPAANETEEEKRFRDLAHAFFERYEKHQDVFHSLSSMRYRFMARFGKDKAELFDPIHRIINEIIFSANEWAMMQINSSRISRLPAIEEAERAEINNLRKIIWYSGNNDEINARIEKIINDVENICKPIITKTYSSTFTNVKNYFKISMNSVFSVAKKIRSKM